MIPNLYQKVRRDPEAVAQEWAALGEDARRAQVSRLLETCPPQPFRPFQTDLATAARQLVVAEVVDAYRERCEAGKLTEPPQLRPLKDFYESNSKEGNRFYQRYQAEWKTLTSLGPVSYLSTSSRSPDLLQAIGRGTGPATPFQMSQVAVSTPKSGPTKVTVNLGKNKSGVELSTTLYYCEDFVPAPETLAIVQDGIRWFVDQGFSPVPVALRHLPGGAHRDGRTRPPCDHAGFKFSGMYVFIGVYPGRTPCTIRHEVLHAVYHHLEKTRPDVVRKTDKIYKQAMAADAGLIFNDEFYMDVFLHAGHPMHDANEFFASAAHAYTHHADRLVQYIQAPNTPAAVRSYATAMWQLLRDQVFHGKVFTTDSHDPLSSK